MQDNINDLLDTLREQTRDWLSITDAAARRGYSVRQVRVWCARGWVRCVKLGKEWRIDPASLDTFTPPKSGPKGKGDGDV